MPRIHRVRIAAPGPAGVDGTDGGTPDWGDIAGTLADQTDLQAALNAKLAGVQPYMGLLEYADGNLKRVGASFESANGNNGDNGNASNIARSDHRHDQRYYTQAEVDGMVGGGGGGAVPVVKVLDTTVGNVTSTGGYALFDLRFSIGANERWAVDWTFNEVYVTGSDGEKWKVATPSGATVALAVTGTGGSAEGVQYSRLSASNTLTGAAFNRIPYAEGWARISGTITAGSTGGTVTPSVASATGGSVTVYANYTTLVARKVA